MSRKDDTEFVTFWGASGVTKGAGTYRDLLSPETREKLEKMNRDEIGKAKRKGVRKDG